MGLGDDSATVATREARQGQMHAQGEAPESTGVKTPRTQDLVAPLGMEQLWFWPLKASQPFPRSLPAKFLLV